MGILRWKVISKGQKHVKLQKMVKSAPWWLFKLFFFPILVVFLEAQLSPKLPQCRLLLHPAPVLLKEHPGTKKSHFSPQLMVWVYSCGIFHPPEPLVRLEPDPKPAGVARDDHLQPHRSRPPPPRLKGRSSIRHRLSRGAHSHLQKIIWKRALSLRSD